MLQCELFLARRILISIKGKTSLERFKAFFSLCYDKANYALHSDRGQSYYTQFKIKLLAIISIMVVYD